MHVRLVTITGADVDAAVKFIEAKVAPTAFEQKGCVQLVAGGDRPRRAVCVLSMWASRSALEASDTALTKLRHAGAAAFGGKETVQFFEQVASHAAATPPEPGSLLWLISYTADRRSVDATIAWLNNDVLAAPPAAPGTVAVRNLIDRGTGNGRVAVVLADQASLVTWSSDWARRAAPGHGRGIAFGQADVLEVLYGAAEDVLPGRTRRPGG